jgi:hypothetical protein
MTRSECDPFLQGYLDAALFTTDPEPPSGCDYVESGRADELFPSLPEWFIEQARKDCAEFIARACAKGGWLSKAGDPWRNGSDFWYTRNGHGVGFWDRGYPDEVADPLTDLCKQFGECYLMAEDFGLQTKD